MSGYFIWMWWLQLTVTSSVMSLVFISLLQLSVMIRTDYDCQWYCWPISLHFHWVWWSELTMIVSGTAGPYHCTSIECGDQNWLWLSVVLLAHITALPLSVVIRTDYDCQWYCWPISLHFHWVWWSELTILQVLLVYIKIFHLSVVITIDSNY